MADLPQLFGVVPTGSPLMTTPSAAPAPTSLVFNLPSTKFTHLTIFLLPGITLPPNTAAAVYIASSPANGAAPNFKFLGGIGPGKESAVYKVSNQGGGESGGMTEVDMDTGTPEGISSLVLGISIEDATSVAERMAKNAASSQNNTTSTAMIKAGTSQNQSLVLAQKIIKNAFNFLASFSGNVPVPGAPGAAGVEVVPLKAFEEWWRKFEGRVRNDPGWLERQDEE